MDKLKQGIFVLMTASLLVTAPISINAKDTILLAESSEKGQINPELMEKINKGLEKANSLLPYLKDYPIMEVEIDNKQSNITVNKYQSKEKKFPVIHLYFDHNTGELLRFVTATGKGGFKSPYPLDKSKEKAIVFMKQWYGEDMDGYQLNEAMSDSNFTITFNKMVNGIPVKNDAVILSVDSQGQIVNKGEDGNQTAIVVSKQQNLTFADPKEALSKQQMEKLFASYMKPSYNLHTDGKTYKLLYAPELLGEIDARTGKVRSVAENRSVIQFQSKGKELFANSKAEATAILAAKTGYDFTQGRVVFEENIDPDKKVTNFLWKTEGGIIGSIFVEKKTGKVTNYQVLDKNQKSEADKKLTYEQALKIAVADMEEVLPLDITEMVLTEQGRYDADMNLYKFDFVMEHQGIPVSDWRTQAHVDAASGKVLLLDWRLPEKGTLPDPKNSISPEEAAKIYLKNHPLELYYSLDEGKEGAVSLVYTLTGDEQQQVDAFTGQLYIYGEEK